MGVSSRIMTQRLGRVVVIDFIDAAIMDALQIQQIASELYSLVDDQDQKRILLDFSNVKFLSSAVLGLLIRISRKIYESEGQFKLCGINPKIQEIFRITRLDRVFDIHADRYDAVQSLD